MWINFKGVFNKTVKKVGLVRWYLKILVKKVEKTNIIQKYKENTLEINKIKIYT